MKRLKIQINNYRDSSKDTNKNKNARCSERRSNETNNYKNSVRYIYINIGITTYQTA